MIAMVRGEVVERDPDHVTVMCGGVGYRLALSAQTLAAVGQAMDPAAEPTRPIARAAEARASSGGGTVIRALEGLAG